MEHEFFFSRRLVSSKDAPAKDALFAECYESLRELVNKKQASKAEFSLPI